MTEAPAVAPLPVDAPVEYTEPKGQLPDMSKLNDILANIGKKAFVLTYDTRSQTMSSSFVFDEPVPFPVFKAVIINSLESFVADYTSMVLAIADAADRAQRRIIPGATGKKESVLSPDKAFNLITRCHNRADHAAARLGEFKGGQFECLLPTAEIVKGNHPQLPDHEINTFESSPYKNGILFIGYHPGYEGF